MARNVKVSLIIVILLFALSCVQLILLLRHNQSGTSQEAADRVKTAHMKSEKVLTLALFTGEAIHLTCEDELLNISQYDTGGLQTICMPAEAKLKKQEKTFLNDASLNVAEEITDDSIISNTTLYTAESAVIYCETGSIKVKRNSSIDAIILCRSEDFNPFGEPGKRQ